MDIENTTHSNERAQTGAQLYEVGQLYFDRGDFSIALQKMTEASDLAMAEGNFKTFLECQNYVLRVYAERNEHEQIMKVKESLQDLVLKEGFELTSRTYSTLGMCASYRNQNETSLEYFKKALELALKADDKEDICHAIRGIATCYANMEMYTESLKEIYNLKVFLEVIDLPNIRFSIQLLNGKVLYKLERYEEALECYWACYEMLETLKSPNRIAKVLYRIGQTYRELGDSNLAKVYLQLAARSIDTENSKPMHSLVTAALETLGVSSGKDFDLVLGANTNVVVEKKKGKVDFKNQFILLDLLHLFVRNPGKTFSKEELVRKIWKQEYNPSVHDNKIYVTIKRLRKMIEPDFDKPKYVFRGKNGYYLNKSAKVFVEQ